jgi:flagellar motor switch protein FliG
LENISAIVAFLSPDLAAKLLASMDIKVVAQISISLLDQRMMPRATMDKLEAHIRSSVECLAGGEPRFQQLVGCFSGPIKKSLLSMLSSNAPDVYRRVRPYVLLFEDIKLLSDDEIKILLSDVRMELFAVALASVDEATYARVDQNLTKSARDMIAQYLDLRGGSISAEDIARAQDTILATIARLESEGKLQLKSKLVA